MREVAIRQGATDARSAGPRGRGLVGTGGGGGGRPVEKKKKGHGWTKRPDGLASCWANWAESEENFFSE
jgi:hypothetical protein